MRILVLGYVVRGPLGGLAWHHLQYAAGLARLGHEVHFFEDSGDYPSCYDPRTDATGRDPRYGLGFAGRALDRLGLGDRWAYFDAGPRRWHGPAAGRVGRVCSDADCLLNVSGMNPIRPWLEQVPLRILIDTDPAFTQIGHLTDPPRRAAALLHNAFFSFAENIGEADCVLPDDGLPWCHTRQPVVLDEWPVTPGPADGSFTCVLLWDSYPAEEFGGVRYGMKSDSFAPYLELPHRVAAPLELAIGSPTAPKASLRQKGWIVRDPREPTRDPWAYQRYIRDSKAEFSIAKHGYAVSRSGWFSERSAAYLASGRPVLAQDTGFSRFLPTGRGLLAFSSADGAVAGMRDVESRYAEHCRAARQIAEEHFDSRVVLRSLLERAATAI
jgi:hypothetical protein